MQRVYAEWEERIATKIDMRFECNSWINNANVKCFKQISIYHSCTL